MMDSNIKSSALNVSSLQGHIMGNSWGVEGSYRQAGEQEVRHLNGSFHLGWYRGVIVSCLSSSGLIVSTLAVELLMQTNGEHWEAYIG